MQEGNGDVLVGTSVLGGFNRRNVLNYIEQLQNRLSETDAAADERLRRVGEELQALRAQMQSLDDALACALADKQALEVSFARVQKENDMLREQLNDARSDLQRQRSAKPSLRKGR